LTASPPTGRFYSGKHRRHGMNLQVIAAPDGEIVGVSGPRPGAVHDLTAARNWGIIRCLVAAGPVTLGGKGCQRAGDLIMTPYKARTSPPRRKTPTAHTRSYAAQGNAPTPSSRPGGGMSRCADR
jgi:hypothetical protein